MHKAIKRIAIATAVGLSLGAAQPATPAPKAGFGTQFASASPLARSVGRALDAALDTAAAGDFTKARQQADQAFANLARFGTSRDVDAFREAAHVRRLLLELEPVPDESRAELLSYLRARPALSRTMAFAVDPTNAVVRSYELLDRFRKERPKQLETYPELAVALCVVRDRPLVRHMNENAVKGVDPLDLFDFYTTHESKMFYGLRGVPVELLAHVVDTTASIANLNWANAKYAGTRDVGALFFTIKYDYAYYNGKADKKVDDAPGGYNLPNVLRFGGVCIDQAYFATSVGKAIGVPTAIATAASAEAGHAWVGYLKSAGKSADWDFNSGRYEEYKGLRGNVEDPQTRRGEADSTVGMLADMIGTNAVQRQDVVALTDAAAMLANADAGETPTYPADAQGKSTLKPPAPRPTTADGQLELIELGLRQFAAYPEAWLAVADLAKDGKLSEPQKHTWADLTMRLCGQRHPDFALAVLGPMVESVVDAKEQSALWDAVYNIVKARPDLSAEVRFHQASLWEKQNDLPRAGLCYGDVIQHDINAGPFAVRALKGAESVLRKMGHPERVLDLYANAAKIVAKPSLAGRAEFARQSNWFKVRELYAARLADAGQTQLADQIRSEDKAG